MNPDHGYDVVIPTYDRTFQLVKCLQALKRQAVLPGKVIVVDALNTETPPEIIELDLQPIELIYLSNPTGRGNTANSRNVGLAYVNQYVTAYLDDDCYVLDGWAQSMLDLYASSDFAAIGGRTLNGIKFEELTSPTCLGTIGPNGEVIGNFQAHPTMPLEVDHMLGANCSWKTSVLRGLGGHYDEYDPGPACLMEETEVCLRARDHGFRIGFCPTMLAFHEGAPQPNSFRFSPKYHYYHMRNQVFMLFRTDKYRHRVYRLFPVTTKNRVLGIVRSIGGHVFKGTCETAGMLVGFLLGIKWLISRKEINTR
jgi:GT2 family glycosyltransferase